MKRKVLIIYSDISRYEKLVILLEQSGYSVNFAANNHDAEKLISIERFNVVIHINLENQLTELLRDKIKNNKLTGTNATLCLVPDKFTDKYNPKKVIYLSSNVNHYMIYQFIENLLYPKLPDKMFKVLLISNDENEKNILSTTIERLGCEILWIKNHKKISTKTKLDDLSIILINSTDIPLDDMLELCKDFKRKRDFQHIPLVVFSSYDEQQYIYRIFFAGANDIIHKPFYPEELWTRLLSHLRIKNLIDELNERIKKEEEAVKKLTDLNIELKEANELSRMLTKALEEQAMTDELTGIFNRRHILHLMKRAVNHSYDYNKEFACIIVDIDNFKHINDNYGHDFGDKVIRETALIINSLLHEDWNIGRWGGEEFVLVLLDCDENRAIKLSERIKTQIKEHIFKSASKNVEVRVTVSQGISILDKANKEKSIDALIKRSDLGLYEAKKTGRDRCVVYKD